MKQIKNWLARLNAAFNRFMEGRYGNDKLNSAILWTGVGLVIVGLFVHPPLPDLILHLLAYGLMGIAIWRALSRNTYKRYRENRKFLMFVDRLKDRKHKYFECPRCHQPVRVPRGKGKIAISCPKCKEKFIKKT